MKNSLISRLKNGLYTGLAAGAFLGAVYGCDRNPVEPSNPPQNTLNISPTSGMSPLEVRIQGRCTDPDGDLREYKIMSGGSIITRTNPIDTLVTLTQDASFSSYCDDMKGNVTNAGPLNVSVSQPPINNSPRTSLNVNPTSGIAPLPSRIQYSCTDLDGLEDIAKSYLIIGNDTLRTNSLDSTFTFNQPATVKGYCEDKKGASSSAGPINIQVLKDQIAFWSNRPVSEGGYNEDIYSGDLVKTAEGRDTLVNVRRLTTHPGKDLEPTYSPDGNEILFTSHRTGGTAVWRMDADGSGQRDITSNIVERARQADWCSNGLIVVAYRDKGDSEAGVGIINPVANSFTPIYSQPNIGGIPEWPSCSPDASEIAFARNVNENWDIWKMNSNGSGLINITNHPVVDGQPAWSPDGSNILFFSDRGGNGSFDIYTINPDGSNIKRITTNSGTEVDPQFSPDGNKLIFAHDLVSFLNPQVYTMNSDGTGWIQLTTEGANRYPSWRPRQ